MSLPFRLRVLNAITEQIKTVTPARTYVDPETQQTVAFTNDLSDYVEQGATLARVFRGRQQFGDTDPLPMVSVLENPAALDALLDRDAAEDRSGDKVSEWDLLIQGFVKDDPDNPTDPAHILCAEVIAALAEAGEMKTAERAPNILGLGYRMPAVTKLAIGNPVVRPADGVNSSQAFFWVGLRLTLAEDVKRPFA